MIVSNGLNPVICIVSDCLAIRSLTAISNKLTVTVLCDTCSWLLVSSFIHSLLVKLTYRSRTQDSSRYTIQTSRSSVTVFIQCSFQGIYLISHYSISNRIVWSLILTYIKLNVYDQVLNFDIVHIVYLISDVTVHPARSDAVGIADDNAEFINGLNSKLFLFLILLWLNSLINV